MSRQTVTRESRRAQLAPNAYGFSDATANNEHPDLLTVVYTQDPQVTPSTTYTYGRHGRRATCVRNSITTTYTYNNVDQGLSESYSGGTLGGLAVTNVYDTLLRRVTNNAWNGSTKLAQSVYTYDAGSRLQTVGDGTNTAGYTYLESVPRVAVFGISLAAVRQPDFLGELFTFRLVKIP